YIAQAEAVLRMAARAASRPERKVYETIAEGWRRLATEARRNERRDGPRIVPTMRSFRGPGH
ncbi:MAG: hypothetical protein JWP50_3435, partial [Phenylobacterium sp.]|nr:hypothetical protein [Phenylobacterium sp.]